MIENVLHTIGGVGEYGVLSIVLFFGFFVAVLVWTLCLKKSYVNAMRVLPLDGDPAPEGDSEITPSCRGRANAAGLQPGAGGAIPRPRESPGIQPVHESASQGSRIRSPHRRGILANWRDSARRYYE